MTVTVIHAADWGRHILWEKHIHRADLDIVAVGYNGVGVILPHQHFHKVCKISWNNLNMTYYNYDIYSRRNVHSVFPCDNYNVGYFADKYTKAPVSIIINVSISVVCSVPIVSELRIPSYWCPTITNRVQLPSLVAPHWYHGNQYNNTSMQYMMDICVLIAAIVTYTTMVAPWQLTIMA